MTRPTTPQERAQIHSLISELRHRGPVMLSYGLVEGRSAELLRSIHAVSSIELKRGDESAWLGNLVRLQNCANESLKTGDKKFTEFAESCQKLAELMFRIYQETGPRSQPQDREAR